MCNRTLQDARLAMGGHQIATRLMVACDHLKAELIPMAAMRPADKAALSTAIAEVEILLALASPLVGASLIDLERVEALHTLQHETSGVPA